MQRAFREFFRYDSRGGGRRQNSIAQNVQEACPQLNIRAPCRRGFFIVSNKEKPPGRQKNSSLCYLPGDIHYCLVRPEIRSAFRCRRKLRAISSLSWPGLLLPLPIMPVARHSPFFPSFVWIELPVMVYPAP